MRAFPVECAGGLDQESSNLEIRPGRVREALNYEALPMGGYRRIDGHVKWSGNADIPDFLSSALQIIEADRLPDAMREGGRDSVFTTALSVSYRFVSFVEIYTNNLVTGYYIAVQLLNERQRLAKGDVLGASGGQVAYILNSDVRISQDSYNGLVTNAFSSAAVATKPEGDGPILQIISTDDKVFAIRSSAGQAKMSQIISTTSVTGEWGLLFNIPMTNVHGWDHAVYEFAGRDREIYLVNGRDRMHLVPTVAGTVTVIGPPDTPVAPSKVIVFKEHLFVATGPTIQHSAIGDPTDWTVLNGAGEIRIGRDVIGLSVVPGGALAIFTDETIDILYGTSSADWRLERYSNEIGMLPGTLQSLPLTIFWDRRGIQMLEATDAYGDFTSNTLSHSFHQLFESMKTDQLHSTVNRAKSQYRIFNRSGRGMYLTFNGKDLVGAMEIDLALDSTILCTGTKKNTVEADDNYLGLFDGTVIKTDIGPSFSGKPIRSYLKFPFWHAGNPMMKKRWMMALMDLTGDPYTKLQGRGEMELGLDYFSDNRVVDVEIEAGIQDRPINDPDAFAWDHQAQMEARMYLEGTSSSMGLVLQQESDTNFSHTIHHIITQFNERGSRR